MAQVPDVDMVAPSTPPAMEPIVFSMPGYLPDTRLNVLGQKFHVHSAYLKMHSAFFRKFLDSPEKKLPATSDTTSTSFRYEWITEVDTDGTWSLVWAGTDTKSPNVTPSGEFLGDKMAEISAFDMILRAIYNWRIIIDTPEQLCLVTQLADYYCALPILSSSLYAAFGRSFCFCSEIRGFEIELLGAAVKLRNDALYKECMVLLMGPWKSPKLGDIEDKELKQLASLAHHKICKDVLQVRTEILQALHVESLPQKARQYRELEAKVTEEHLYHNNGAILLPALCREMFDKLEGKGLDRYRNLFGSLLGTELRLHEPSGVAGDSGAWSEDRFLCLKARDEDLPWDINERDW